ncbi:uncharacterized protein LOC114480600 [Gouania willdenowi]|uniref:uncharacterized protein LOC114480600 n=1 Tax=Gouania willdenowi TaxID=441366 RepID=UPI001054FE5B|nr:uncharacterized protein LOC114480600 [Gouania willdenowi]
MLVLDSAVTPGAMSVRLSFGVALVLFLSSPVRSEIIPDEVHHMECHDRYLMIAADLSFTGNNPRFVAVDKKGLHELTKPYQAKCGYSITHIHLLNLVELRASFFSCHTENINDQVFMFNIHLITMHNEVEKIYALNKTCSPSVPWSPREVTCEANYIEVSLGNEVSCRSRLQRDELNSTKVMQSSVASDWQVMFQRADEQMLPMNLSQAKKQGYMFDFTDGRLVFRTPYEQPECLLVQENGVPVEMIHATLFSKQGWIVLMVDLVVACSMYPGSYENGYVIWKTPEILFPGFHSTKINMGLNGNLVEQQAAEQKGYTVEVKDNTIDVGIPNTAEGGYRRSFVVDHLYEFYTFCLCFEQVLMDNNGIETTLRFHRTLMTPLLPCSVYTENQTNLEDHKFTVYVGDVPEDVELTSIHLNGHERQVHCTNKCSHNITRVSYHNNTHGYILEVPFDDPVALCQYLEEESVLQYSLDINYTLTVKTQSKPYYHLASIVATFTDVSPPVFDVDCLETGISFKLGHRPFDFLWEIFIGSEPLTAELATHRGYFLSNNSQSLLLEVPLFTDGYEYTEITLGGFFGTFTILMKNAGTSVAQTSTEKTCPFSSNELIMCSTDGRITAVVDVSLVMSHGGLAMGTKLLDKRCRPKETDKTRALFSFPVSSCGTMVKIGRQNVTYINEISYQTSLNVRSGFLDNATERSDLNRIQSALEKSPTLCQVRECTLQV